MKYIEKNPFLQLMKSVPVCELANNVGDAFTVSKETPLMNLMREMREKNLDLAVMEENQCVIGFVEIADIMEYIMNRRKIIEGENSKEVIYNFRNTLMSTEVNKIAGVSKKHICNHISGADNLTVPVLQFISGLVDHCIVFKYSSDKNKSIADHIISSKDIVNFISLEIMKLEESPSEEDKPLLSLIQNSLIGNCIGLGVLETRKIISVSTTDTVSDAFQVMIGSGISVAPVVDSERKILRGKFDVTDVLFCNPEKSKQFANFNKNIMQFLHDNHLRHQFPVTAQLSTTLEAIIHTFATTETHSIILVDNNHFPINILTLTDLLRIMIHIQV
jgi:CBS domain containing-hemolysin-like protein